MRAAVHRPAGRPWWRIAVGAAAGVAAGIAISGCEDPTVVLTTVNADQTVPLLTQLTTDLSSVADPSVHVSSMLIAAYPGTFDGGLPPIFLPAQFSLSVDPAYLSGPAIVRIDGVDNDTGAILATGSAPAQIVPQEQTEATVTLTAVGRCATGGDGGATGDAGAACDGGVDGGTGG